MTGEEWVHSVHPERMLEHVVPQTGERKLRLFFAELIKTVEPHLTDERSRNSIRVAAEYADGSVVEDVRIEAFMASKDAVQDAEAKLRGRPEEDQDGDPAPWRIEGVATWLAQVPSIPCLEEISANEVLEGLEVIAAMVGTRSRTEHFHFVSTVIRDIFGNPFRPVDLRPPLANVGQRRRRPWHLRGPGVRADADPRPMR